MSESVLHSASGGVLHKCTVNGPSDDYSKTGLSDEYIYEQEIVTRYPDQDRLCIRVRDQVDFH